ncbi:MAG: sigma factor G inhibitor Gin [Firmicutes bacterium]|nr:sigma factor G inhibitor Gin [Bacillota bacterium]
MLEDPQEQEAPVQVCMICEQAGKEGIHILSQFICLECEREIVNTGVDDDLYDYFVERMRALWRDLANREPDLSGPTYS